MFRKIDEEVKDDAGFDVHFALALFDLQKHIEGWHIPEYRYSTIIRVFRVLEYYSSTIRVLKEY